MTEQEHTPSKPLLPCPFCGKEPKMKTAPNHADVILFWIVCDHYGCPTSVSTHMGCEKEVIKFWNNRKGVS